MEEYYGKRHGQIRGNVRNQYRRYFVVSIMTPHVSHVSVNIVF